VHVLGIDTATSKASVGIWANGVVVAEEHTSSRNHAASLLPLVDCVLNAAHSTMRSIDRIAISAGPGSFSGLRVGVSVAKGLALASGCRVTPISTLEALAATVADRDGVICSLLDAHKDQLYLGRFEARGGELRRLAEDTAACIETILAAIPRHSIVIGDAVTRYGPILKEALGNTVEILPFPEFGPRGGIVASLAVHLPPSPLDTVEPFYIRPPDVNVSI